MQGESRILMANLFADFVERKDYYFLVQHFKQLTEKRIARPILRLQFLIVKPVNGLHNVIALCFKLI